MKLLITGSSGYVGGFIAADAKRNGDEIIHLSRTTPATGQWISFDLSRPTPKLPSADALIHCAFDHIEGHYRGGEGDDAKGFLVRNLEGSLNLFKAAKAAGVPKIILLSSRAVYDGYPASTRLVETLPLNPTTLYGQMKWELEKSLKSLGLIDISFRATGVYGQSIPGGPHKWADLFAGFEQGKAIEPRAGTELHGEDLAAASRLALTLPATQIAGKAFNLSDIMVDRHELLTRYAKHKGIDWPRPKAVSNVEKVEMDCTNFKKLGWTPRGWKGLESFIQSF